MDKKWSFVAKKEKNCDEDDPEDQFRGQLDHVALTPSTAWSCRRTWEADGESVQELVTDVKERLDGRVPELITTDEYRPMRGRSWRRSARRWYRRGPASRGGAEGV